MPTFGILKPSDPTKGRSEYMKACLNVKGTIHLSETVNKPLYDPESDELVIKIYASSVNPIDWKLARGDLWPIMSSIIPGRDIAGIVVAVGQKVRDFKVGDKVWLDTGTSNAYAEYIVISEKRVALMPLNLSYNLAASMPLTALTAYQGLVKSRTTEGKSLLVVGGSSGVGSMAIQLAKILHLSEIYAVCGPHSIPLIKELGATVAIDYSSEDIEDKLGKESVDVIFDVVGSDYSKLFPLLRKGGTIITCCIWPSTVTVTNVIRFLSHIAYTTIRCLLNQRWFKLIIVDHTDITSLNKIREWVESKELKPVVQDIFNVEQANDAWDLSKKGHVKGKLVIQIDEEIS